MKKILLVVALTASTLVHAQQRHIPMATEADQRNKRAAIERMLRERERSFDLVMRHYDRCGYLQNNAIKAYDQQAEMALQNLDTGNSQEAVRNVTRYADHMTHMYGTVGAYVQRCASTLRR